MYLPNSLVVFCDAIKGVPVKAILGAFGSAALMAPPSDPYWVRCASSAKTMIRSESFRQVGIASVASTNFWIVEVTRSDAFLVSSSLRWLTEVALRTVSPWALLKVAVSWASN